jgi:hypothetical protein
MGGLAFQSARGYRLDPSNHPQGVGCDESGPNLGPFRLLHRTAQGVEPRSLSDLDFLLSQTFDEPITSAVLRLRLAEIAKLLNADNIPRAMIATQLLKLPVLDPEQTKRALKAERMLKAGFNPDEARDTRGRWTGAETGTLAPPKTTNPVEHRNPLLVPAQAILVEPMIGDLPIAGPIPLPMPMDIVPPVVGNPDVISPRTPTTNPYPEKRKCVEEWAKANEYCYDLKRRGLLGANGYRGFGKGLSQCIRGMVSEECGGNPTA